MDASHGALPAGALQAQIRHVIKKCAECVCVCVCVCLRSLRVEDVLCGWNDGRAASTHTRVFLMQEDKISSIYYIYIYVTYNNNDACFMFGVLFGLLCIAQAQAVPLSSSSWLLAHHQFQQYLIY